MSRRSLIALHTALIAALTLAVTTPAQSPRNPHPVMDLHSDIINRALNFGIDLGDTNDWSQCLLGNMEEGNVSDVVFSIWVNSRSLRGFEATSRALRMIGLVQHQLERHSDRIALAHSVAEAREINESGRIAGWMVMEGGAPIDSDIELLRGFHALGVRGMTLTWMDNLSWAGSSTDDANPEMGLTEQGRTIVQEMNSLGMVIDLSHVSDQTFYETLAITSDPVMISHSNCRALADHPRNVSDDMLQALAENGGVIGLNVYTGYLSAAWEEGWDATAEALSEEINAQSDQMGGWENPEFREWRRRLITENLPEEAQVTVDTYLDHIEHAIAVAGPEHVAIGSDFDGVWAFPVGIERPNEWHVVVEGLRARGHSADVVQGLMRENARRVFEQVIDQ